MNKLTFQVAFLASIIILLSVSYFSFQNLKKFQEDANMVVHTQSVKDELALLRDLSIAFSRDLRNAILGMDTVQQDDLAALKSKDGRYLSRLDSLISDNPTQIIASQQLRSLLENYITTSSEAVKKLSMDSILVESNRKLLREEEAGVDQVLKKIATMREVENNLLIERSKQATKSKIWAPVTLASLVLVAVCIICFLIFNTFSLYSENENKALKLTNQVQVLNEEIAKRERLQALLKSTFDSTQHGIISYKAIRDSKDEIINFSFGLLNKEAMKIIGQNDKELVGKTILDVFQGIKDSGLFDEYVKVVNTGIPFKKEIFYEYDNFQTWFFIRAVKSGDGCVITFSDITDTKNNELQLKRKQSELEATNFELEQFAYIASHDLQEPLRKVRAFGDRLASKYQDNLDDKGQDYIKRMQDASARMQTLIDDLLKFSRISRSEWELSNLSLNDPLTQAIDNLEIEIRNKSAEIIVTDLPEVKGDKGQLTQLFQNLLSNSLKYAKDDEPPVISINSELVSGIDSPNEPEVWKITVKDNGIGFDEKYQDQIFDIFQRLHGRNEYSGTGIGLAICEKIVANHGGRIEAEGEPGVGATFNFYLPKV